jgi:hypothetical protein
MHVIWSGRGPSPEGTVQTQTKNRADDAQQMSSQAEFITPSPVAKGEKRHSASQYRPSDAPKQHKPNETEIRTSTPQQGQGPIIPSTPCTPRTLASFNLERSRFNSILSRTHTITSLGNFLEFAAECVAINGQPANSAAYGLLPSDGCYRKKVDAHEH